jgi:hypothetical protein
MAGQPIIAALSEEAAETMREALGFLAEDGHASEPEELARIERAGEELRNASTAESIVFNVLCIVEAIEGMASASRDPARDLAREWMRRHTALTRAEEVTRLALAMDSAWEELGEEGQERFACCFDDEFAPHWLRERLGWPHPAEGAPADEAEAPAAPAVYRPRNRNVAPGLLAFEAEGLGWCVDDIDAAGNPIAWGALGNGCKIMPHGAGRFILCNSAGAFLKHAPRKGASRGPVRYFRTREEAARVAVALAGGPFERGERC